MHQEQHHLLLEMLIQGPAVGLLQAALYLRLPISSHRNLPSNPRYNDLLSIKSVCFFWCCGIRWLSANLPLA